MSSMGYSNEEPTMSVNFGTFNGNNEVQVGRDGAKGGTALFSFKYWIFAGSNFSDKWLIGNISFVLAFLWFPFHSPLLRSIYVSAYWYTLSKVEMGYWLFVFAYWYLHYNTHFIGLQWQTNHHSTTNMCTFVSDVDTSALFY